VESAQKMAATYSGGMRRKLDLAMTLVTRPQPAQPGARHVGEDAVVRANLK